MLKKEIILHVGTPKTASTAIQQCLTQNREILRELGYLYKCQVGVNHTVEMNGVSLADSILHQIALAEDVGLKKIIVSNELLAFRDQSCLNKLKKSINGIAKIKTIVYLRRQDEYMEAGWKQWGFKQLKYSCFEDFFNDDSVPNYLKAIRQWEAISDLGINVVPFSKEWIRNSPQEHFFELLGVPREKFGKFDFDIPEDMQNRGFGKKGMQFAFLSRELAGDNPGNTVIEKIIENYLPSLLKQRGESYDILSDTQRRQVLEEWRGTNETIAKQYLDGKYPFVDPDPRDDTEVRVEPEDVTKALMEALYYVQFPPQDKLRGKKIAVFGAGRSGRLTVKYLERNHPNTLKCIIDDDPGLKKYRKYPIYSTKEFLKTYQYTVDIVIYGAFQRLSPKLLEELLIPRLRLEAIY